MSISNFTPLFSEVEIRLFWNVLIPTFTIIATMYITLRVAEIKRWFGLGKKI